MNIFSVDEDEDDLKDIEAAPEEIKKWLTSTFAKAETVSSNTVHMGTVN